MSPFNKNNSKFSNGCGFFQRVFLFMQIWRNDLQSKEYHSNSNETILDKIVHDLDDKHYEYGYNNQKVEQHCEE